MFTFCSKSSLFYSKTFFCISNISSVILANLSSLNIFFFSVYVTVRSTQTIQGYFANCKENTRWLLQKRNGSVGTRWLQEEQTSKRRGKPFLVSTGSSLSDKLAVGVNKLIRQTDFDSKLFILTLLIMEFYGLLFRN